MSYPPIGTDSFQLSPVTALGGSVEKLPEDVIRLSIPAGAAGDYRLAQLDDTQNLPRSEFRWQSPCILELRARVSAADLPGTWGFGLWNDPFSASLGVGGGTRKLPVFPDAAWFFHASSANSLSLRDDLPANGFLAATFSSRKMSPLLLVPAVLAAPLLFWRVTARWIRRIARSWIKEDSTSLTIDPTDWHRYRIEWRTDAATFQVDGQTVLQTAVAPHGTAGAGDLDRQSVCGFHPAGTGGLRYTGESAAGLAGN